MPVFTYNALNEQGKEEHGQIEAGSNDEAISLIRAKNLFPTNVAEKSARKTKTAAVSKGKSRKTFAIGKVKTKQLTVFTRQLSTLLDAGLPLVRSLKILQDQTRPGPLKNQLIDVTDDVEAGMNLSEAFGKHPKTFDKLFCNVVKAGEAGGVLEPMLQRLATFMEKSQKLKRQIVAALAYPAGVMGVAAIILTVILVLIVPKFQEMFEGLGTGMPRPTQILIDIGFVMRQFWYLLPGIPLGIFVLLKIIRMSARGRYILDYIKLHLPVAGTIASKSTISRFARTLGTLLASGVPILEALRIVKDATGNEVIGRAINNVHSSIREGDSIAGPLRQSKVTDVMVVSMIEVGEQTGELHNMLIKISDTYDEEVDALVGGLMSLLEPFMILFLGAAVGSIVLALFLPLIKLMSAASGGSSGI